MLAVGVALAAPTVARAGTVYVADDGTRKVLHVVADPGEVNDVSLSVAADPADVQITDSGTISPGAGCVQGGTSISALCDRAGVDEVVVELGDESDKFGSSGLVGMPVTIDGGDGDDQLSTGFGPSRLNGGPGDDWLFAYASESTVADVFSGGTGHDTVFYTYRFTPQTITIDDIANDGSPGEGDDVRSDVEEVQGGFGDDTITGSPNADVLQGGEGVDTLDGLAGEDTLDGWLGCSADIVKGGEGDDTLIINGSAQVDGGPDDDTLKAGIERCGGTDVRGGAGHDTADLREFAEEDEVFSLDDVANDGLGGTENYHSDIEDMKASAYKGMVLIGSDGPNVLTGGPNDDLLMGGGGADTLIGGDGFDVADYSDHADPVTLTLNGAADDGSPGEQDQIATDVEDLRGGAGDDTLTGDAQDNALDGGTGADVITGGDGLDAVDYSQRGAAVHVDLDGSPGNDGAQGEGDTVGADIEGAFGGLGDDTLIGNHASGFLVGFEGNDLLVDPGGSDVLDGGSGDDVLDSTDGALDVNACGNGDDQVWRDAQDEVADDCESVAIGPRRDPPPGPLTPQPPAPAGPATLPRPLQPLRTPPVSPASADRLAPRAQISLKKGATLRTLRRRGLQLDIRCDESCHINARLIARRSTAQALRRAGIPPGTTLARGSTAGSTPVQHLRLRPTAIGRRALARLRTASLDVILTITDRAGNHRRIVRHINLRR